MVRASRARSIRYEFEVHQPTIWMDTIGECHEIMLSCDNRAQRGYREKLVPGRVQKDDA